MLQRVSPLLPKHCASHQSSFRKPNTILPLTYIFRSNKRSHYLLSTLITSSQRVQPTLYPKMSSPAPKRARLSSTSPSPYELIYWPSIPGRGEHIRLTFEEAGVAYKDVSNESKDGINAVLSQISDQNLGEGFNPPPLAPPVLRHGDLVISQTPSILLYLGPKLGLVTSRDDDPDGMFHVNALTLTALDGFSNEVHDTHHPVSTGSYYEDQIPESKRKAADYISARLPKYLGYFERVLKSEGSKGGEWLYGGQLTYADLVLFQGLDGVGYAFPNAMKALRESKKYEGVFALVDRVRARENIKKYLDSERRKPYNMGIYRHYPELDSEVS